MKVKIIKNSFIILLIAIFLITGFLCLFSCDINYEEDDLLLGAIPTEYQKKSIIMVIRNIPIPSI